MSLSIALQWCERFLASPPAVSFVQGQIHQALNLGVEATFLMGGFTLRDRRARLLRWTNHEVFVFELTPAQQLAFNVHDSDLTANVESPGGLRRFPVRLASELTSVQFFDPMNCDGNTPIAGRCRWRQCDLLAMRGCKPALEIIYFHPQVRERIVQYWYPPRSAVESCLDLDFSFDPLVTDRAAPGPMAVFIHMVDFHDTPATHHPRRISNCGGRILGPV